MSGINNLFTEPLTKLSKFLAEKFDLESDQVFEAIENFSETKATPKKTVKKIAPKTTPKKVVKKAAVKKIEEPEDDDVEEYEEEIEVKKPKKAVKKSVAKSTVNKCPFVLTKGENAGKPCGLNAKNEYKGKMYCGIHSKCMETAKDKPAVKKSAPKTKAQAKKVADSKSQKLVNKVTKKENTILRVNEFGNLCDINTNIVWEENPKRVLGNQEEDGEIGELTEEQKQICEQNNWDFSHLEYEQENEEYEEQENDEADQEEAEQEYEEVEVEQENDDQEYEYEEEYEE